VKTGRPVYWTPERSLDALRRLAAELGRSPTSREIGTSHCPSTKYFQKYFGSYNRALRLAGLETNNAGMKPLAKIDPAKAAEITRRKMSYWANGGKEPTAWVHPYARRSA
jgi:hypothetical protein